MRAATNLKNSTEFEKIKLGKYIFKKPDTLTVLTVDILNVCIRLMRSQMRLYWEECTHVHTPVCVFTAQPAEVNVTHIYFINWCETFCVLHAGIYTKFK